MPLAIVAYGASFVPVPVVSLPLVADTNVPVPSMTTHGSVDGSTVFAAHVVSHPAPAPWKPLPHVAPHVGPPSDPATHGEAPPSTAGKACPQPPQWFGSFSGLTHTLPQRSGVPASALHA